MKNVIIMEELKDMSAKIAAMEAQLATSGAKGYARERKDTYIEENRESWVSIAAPYKAWREAMNLSKTYVAGKLGIALSTLSRWEYGGSSKIAKTIQAGYDMLRVLEDLKVLVNKFHIEPQPVDYQSILIGLIAQNLQEGIGDEDILDELAITLHEHKYSRYVTTIAKEIKQLKDGNAIAKFVNQVYDVCIDDQEIQQLKDLSTKSFAERYLLSGEVIN
jgi:transcriptional regulator with XRE-family HTH domain